MEDNKKGAGQGALTQHFPPVHSTRSRLQVAREILLDAITASGVDDFAAMAIRAAADSYAREHVRAEFAAFRAELDLKEVA